MLTPRPRLVLSTDKARSRIRTIALVARKGGSGKSTIATALAVAHELAGGRAVVLRRQPVGGHLYRAPEPVCRRSQDFTYFRALWYNRANGGFTYPRHL